ncbi:MAG: hypothetical protein SAJ12_20505, partial [Jaaginema sp. PMC 1079.18]|nr:hypothetical protein [Jaaginema sp. PMC 1079.18]
MNSKIGFLALLRKFSQSLKKRQKAGAIALASGSILLSLNPVGAQTPQKLGVIRSPENRDRWSSINNRLQQVGIDYCVLDLNDLNSRTNLDALGVIFLPSVETLDGVQVGRLQQWLSQGGAIVASGPTGSLSSPAVRTQLRSLLG